MTGVPADVDARIAGQASALRALTQVSAASGAGEAGALAFANMVVGSGQGKVGASGPDVVPTLSHPGLTHVLCTP